MGSKSRQKDKGPRKVEREAKTVAARKGYGGGGRVAAICVALAVGCILVYGQTLNHEFVNYDDDLYVTDNAPVKAGLTVQTFVYAFTSTTASYLHPLTWLSHALDCQVYGMKAWGHHLTNLLFHTADSILLFLVLLRMTRKNGDSLHLSLWPSALVSALFAIHPIHVESVAWVAERKDVLSMFFWVLGMGAYARYVERRTVGNYLLVTVCFLLGIMSKPMMVTFPCALLLLDYWPLGRLDDALVAQDVPLGRRVTWFGRRGLWLAIEKIPWFFMTVLSAFSTAYFQHRSGNLGYGNVVRLPARAANAAVAYVVYLMKAVWPAGLAAFYPHPHSRPAWQVAGAVVVLAAITGLVLVNWRKRPYLAMGWFWYLGTLVPVIELVQAGAFAYADRYTYIPLIGFFIMIAWGGADLVRARRIPAKAVAAGTGVVLVALAFCAGVQTGYWRDSLTLFEHALAVTEGNHQAHCNIGDALAAQGKFDEAAAEYEMALELYPDHRSALVNSGNALAMAGHPDKAIERFERAIATGAETADIDINLGNAYAQQQQFEKAVGYFQKAVALTQTNPAAYVGLGLALASLGRYEEAASPYKRALELDPGNVVGYTGLGAVLANLGRLEEAMPVYERALKIDPKNADAREVLDRIKTELARRSGKTP